MFSAFEEALPVVQCDFVLVVTWSKKLRAFSHSYQEVVGRSPGT